MSVVVCALHVRAPHPHTAMDDWLDDDTQAAGFDSMTDWHRERADRDHQRLIAERAAAGYQDALGASLDAGREQGAKDGFKVRHLLDCCFHVYIRTMKPSRNFYSASWEVQDT